MHNMRHADYKRLCTWRLQSGILLGAACNTNGAWATKWNFEMRYFDTTQTNLTLTLLRQHEILICCTNLTTLHAKPRTRVRSITATMLTNTAGPHAWNSTCSSQRSGPARTGARARAPLPRRRARRSTPPQTVRVRMLASRWHRALCPRNTLPIMQSLEFTERGIMKS